MTGWMRLFLVLGTAASLLAMVVSAARRDHILPARSPYAVSWSADGAMLAVTDRTAGSLYLLGDGRLIRTVTLRGQPTGVCWSGGRCYVAEYGAGTVAEIESASGRVLRRFAVDRHPYDVAAHDGILWVSCRSTHRVYKLSLRTAARQALQTVHEPGFLALSPNGAWLAVSGQTPGMDSRDLRVSTRLALISTRDMRAFAVGLPAGSTNGRQVRVSPDGRYAYVTHTIGHVTLPTSQLDRGWVNTNALSIIDMTRHARLATVLLDRVSEGAADPWGLALSPDGRTGWITLSGVHRLARIDIGGLHRLLSGDGAGVWRDEPEGTDACTYDLSAMYRLGLVSWHDIIADGPRGVALRPDGRQLAVCSYFTGKVLLMDPHTPHRSRPVSLGPMAPDTVVRRGEKRFHDARLCFQRWLSCATCHPEGRADGLNWDLLNDGIGNPKNTRSLLYSARTPPVMTLGIRESARLATRTGYRFIQFHDPPDAYVEETYQYIASLQPEVSPHRTRDGRLTASAERGRRLFADRRTGCSGCHKGALGTDMRLYDVGTATGHDAGRPMDTPTCVELWRTGPWLAYGQAASLTSVLTKWNAGDLHGHTSHLTPAEKADLAAYLASW